MHVRATILVFGTAFVAPLLVVLSCSIPPPLTAYRCQPSSSKPDRRCPDGEQCCSDDPTAIDLFDLAGPGLPNYRPGNTGIPVFAAENNDAGDWGMCIQSGSVAPAFAILNGCPVPCNPTWDADSVEAVCGNGTFCCQTSELDASDCVLDPEIGDDGCWRPVRGDDIVGLGGLEATNWTASEHATHQDAGFLGCESFVAGLTEDELDAAAVSANEVGNACLRRLGVANQRGYCIGGPGVVGCPLAQPSYRDACEQLNDSEFRAGCT